MGVAEGSGSTGAQPAKTSNNPVMAIALNAIVVLNWVPDLLIMNITGKLCGVVELVSLLYRVKED